MLYRWRRLWLGLAIALWIVGCQPQPVPESQTVTSDNSIPVFLNGAGATFPAPLYQRWFREYGREHPNIQINYQPIGSGAGIQQILNQTVDFGGSDIAMTDEEMAAVERGVVLLPVTAGSVAIAYNLPDIKSGLRLSRPVYTDIFLGKITRWNDPELARLNPDLTLPDLPIVLIHRSDASGTTATLTQHLAAISPTWQEQVGGGLSVPWVAGVGVKSNSGVSAQIQQAEGAIGYVEYSYARELGLSIAALENRAGNYVEPNVENAIAALNSVELPENLRVFVPDPDGVDAYPIVTYSWLLIYQQYEDDNKGQALQDMVRWCLQQGQTFSAELGYVPLPEAIVDRVEASLDRLSDS